MIGHLGTRASALLDGRVGADEADRLWEHVHGCHQCRDLVERLGAVKTRLGGLGAAPTAGAPDHLKGALKAGLTQGETRFMGIKDKGTRRRPHGRPPGAGHVGDGAQLRARRGAGPRGRRSLIQGIHRPGGLLLRARGG